MREGVVHDWGHHGGNEFTIGLTPGQDDKHMSVGVLAQLRFDDATVTLLLKQFTGHQKLKMCGKGDEARDTRLKEKCHRRHCFGGKSSEHDLTSCFLYLFTTSLYFSVRCCSCWNRGRLNHQCRSAEPSTSSELFQAPHDASTINNQRHPTTRAPDLAGRERLHGWSCSLWCNLPTRSHSVDANTSCLPRPDNPVQNLHPAVCYDIGRMHIC